MNQHQTNILISLLEKKGIHFKAGLNEKEVSEVESKYSITFPPDYLRFLKTAYPISESFVPWKESLNSLKAEKEVKRRLNWPFEGMLFDIKMNTFWDPSWGKKPSFFKAQKAIAYKNYLSYPKLIPIYSHRYIPSVPCEVENPVFSVHQTDIIYYGKNLADYFASEFYFNLPKNFFIPEKPKYIKFWSDCVVLH